MSRAFAWIGPYRERRAKEKSTRRLGHSSSFAVLQNAIVLEPSWGWPTSRTQAMGALLPTPPHSWPSTEQAFSPTILTDRTWPMCQAQHSQETHSLVSGKMVNRKLMLFVAIAEPTNRLELSLVSFFHILKNAPPPWWGNFGYDFQAEWTDGVVPP